MTNDPEIAVYRYARNAVIADGFRALAGLIVTFGPLAVFNVGSVMVYILGGLGALFIVFGFRTLLRHLTHVEVSAGGIRVVNPFVRAIRWRNLDGLSLSYYTTRRDKLDGWMLLKLKGNGSVLTLDSSLDGFGGIVRRALEAARANKVALSPSTLMNLPSMGIEPSMYIDEPPTGA